MAAMGAEPSSPWAHFELARELAVRGNDKDAIAHLEVLYQLDTPLSRHVLLLTEGESELRSVWNNPRLVAIIDDAAQRSAVTEGDELDDPGCAGWSAHSGAVMCTWHCETTEAGSEAGLLVVRPNEEPLNIDLKPQLSMDDPRAHRLVMAEVAEQLAALEIAPRKIPSWPLRPGASTRLAEGYEVIWQTSSLRPHVFEIRGPGGDAIIEAGGPDWRGCGQPVDHTQPIEAVAYLIPRLGLVAIVAGYAKACCDEISEQSEESWTGMGFVFIAAPDSVPSEG